MHNSHRYGRTEELPLTFIPVIVSSRKSRCFNSSFFQLEFLRDLYSANGSPHDWLARWVLYISVESVELDRRDAVTVRGEMDVKCIVVCDPLRNWKTVGLTSLRISIEHLTSV